MNIIIISIVHSIMILFHGQRSLRPSLMVVDPRHPWSMIWYNYWIIILIFVFDLFSYRSKSWLLLSKLSSLLLFSLIFHDGHHGQRSQKPLLSVDKLGLIHSYYKLRYVDCSVRKWTIPRGIDSLFNHFII